MLNKVDLPGAEPERVTAEIVDLIGCDPDDDLPISAKTGKGSATCSRRWSGRSRRRGAIRRRRRGR